MKVKIIEKVNINYGKTEKEFIIQEKSFFGWKNLEIKELNVLTPVVHNSYLEAEEYLYSNFFKSGVTIKNGNLYNYSPYSLVYY